MKPVGRRSGSVKAILEAVAKRPENQQCADCHAAGPRWVSINLGVFLCIDCSGLHRDLGTHVSKIKSVSLDEWQPDLVEFLSGLGNKICNEYYEAEMPPGLHRPSPKSQALRDFIQRKYEFKEWIPKGSVFSPADLLRQGKDPGSVLPKTSPPVVVGPLDNPLELLGEKPAAGKSRTTKKKVTPSTQKTKTRQTEGTSSVTPRRDAPQKISPRKQLAPALLPDDIFDIQDAPAVSKGPSKANPKADDLLGDFWDPEEPMASKETAASPQSLGYVIQPPSFRRVQEAKTAGAKEAQLQCMTDPASLCLGPPTYQTIFPSETQSISTNIDSWFADTLNGSTELKWSPSPAVPPVVQTPASGPNSQQKEDSFMSAINRNLDQLSVLTSR
eukprot:Protomagalhaensia_sp_Gyna_25__5935@NODE_90_length_5345_cov_47_646626_g63_i1_p2_GENE_NODE_90_length_5345_cov_47_646626_g63_i1NODE_90_length_5345_cov_47_646626_g63_i1_p2_ORF_typecomplete_len386_score48_75ArfGap/PF01412_18/5_1e40_NODE_90_length_5345_cov_47_646626_g63_i12631420